MGISYILLGKQLYIKSDVDSLKEALKNFEYSAQVFKEAQTMAARKILMGKGNDFSESSMNCCVNYALALAQETMYKFACLKGLAPDTRKKLAKGVSDYFSKALRSSSSLGIDLEGRDGSMTAILKKNLVIQKKRISKRE